MASELVVGKRPIATALGLTAPLADGANTVSLKEKNTALKGKTFLIAWITFTFVWTTFVFVL